MNKKQLTRKIAKIIGNWKDVHDDKVFFERDYVKKIEVEPSGTVFLTIKPSRPHCPCCLLNLKKLSKKLRSNKQIHSVNFKIIDVPEPHRWMQILND